MDKAMWGVPSTICTVVNHGSLLGIWFGLLCLQGSPSATDHKLGMQLLVVTSAFSLKPVLTRLEIWEVRMRKACLESERSAGLQDRARWSGYMCCFGAVPSQQLQHGWHSAPSEGAQLQLKGRRRGLQGF